jgi:hypothetical protein
MALTKKSGMGEQLNIQLLSGQERETSNFGFFFLKKKSSLQEKKMTELLCISIKVKVSYN